VFSNVGKAETREGRIAVVGRGRKLALKLRFVFGTELCDSQKRGEKTAADN
jgi:hypothetical protein